MPTWRGMLGLVGVIEILIELPKPLQSFDFQVSVGHQADVSKKEQAIPALHRFNILALEAPDGFGELKIGSQAVSDSSLIFI